MAGVWRGRVTRIDADGRVYVNVPRLNRAAELVVAVVVDAGGGRDLEPGDGVLLGLIEGRPDDLVIVARTTGEAVNPPTEPPPGSVVPAMFAPAVYDDAALVAETAFGQAPDPGVEVALARADHTHGTPPEPPPPVAAGADEALIWMIVTP